MSKYIYPYILSNIGSELGILSNEVRSDVLVSRWVVLLSVLIGHHRSMTIHEPFQPIL